MGTRSYLIRKEGKDEAALGEMITAKDEMDGPLRKAHMELLRARAEFDKVRKVLGRKDKSGWQRFAKEAKRAVEINSNLVAVINGVDELWRAIEKG